MTQGMNASERVPARVSDTSHRKRLRTTLVAACACLAATYTPAKADWVRWNINLAAVFDRLADGTVVTPPTGALGPTPRTIGYFQVDAGRVGRPGGWSISSDSLQPPVNWQMEGLDDFQIRLGVFSVDLSDLVPATGPTDFLWELNIEVAEITDPTAPLPGDRPMQFSLVFDSRPLGYDLMSLGYGPWPTPPAAGSPPYGLVGEYMREGVRFEGGGGVSPCVPGSGPGGVEYGSCLLLATVSEPRYIPTPEPASLALLGVGLVGLVGLKRTRRRNTPR